MRHCFTKNKKQALSILWSNHVKKRKKLTNSTILPLTMKLTTAFQQVTKSSGKSMQDQLDSNQNLWLSRQMSLKILSKLDTQKASSQTECLPTLTQKLVKSIATLLLGSSWTIRKRRAGSTTSQFWICLLNSLVVQKPLMLIKSPTISHSQLFPLSTWKPSLSNSQRLLVPM